MAEPSRIELDQNAGFRYCDLFAIGPRVPLRWCMRRTRTEDTPMQLLMRRLAIRSSVVAAVSLAAFALSGAVSPGNARADEPHGFLETVHKHVTLTSTVPDNGDQNPYAIVVAPVSAGKVQKDDV